MAKKKTPHFIIEFPLQTEIYQEHILNKRFDIARRMQNAVLSMAVKRYFEMTKTIKFRELLAQLGNDKKKNEPVWLQIFKMMDDYRIGKSFFEKDIKSMQKHFKKNIDSFTAQKIALKVWEAFDDVLFGKGEDFHFKKYGQLNSVEGKSNNTGIRYIRRDDHNYILWFGLMVQVDNDRPNCYEWQALQNPVSYCRICRRFIKGKYKYYVQLVMQGKPPVKFDNETGEVKHYIGTGDVGIDIGTSTVAVVSRTESKLIELADKVQNIENEKRRILRKMDRSRRAMNPDNYNENGTIKNKGSRKVTWIKSNHYLKLEAELRELYRKQADIRKYQHEVLANEILALGDTFYVEDMNFQALAKRSKRTEMNDNGKYKKKKRFGKSIGNRAPAMLLRILDRKLHYFDKKLIKIDTKKAKASQFSHLSQDCKKKKLSQRWNFFSYKDTDIKVQRDLYSAFLIMNISEDLATFDLDKCDSRFEVFLKQHDNEIARLRLENMKNTHTGPSCMGIW